MKMKTALRTLLAAALLAPAAAFAHHPGVSVGIGIGLPGIYIGGGRPVYYDDYYYRDPYCYYPRYRAVRYRPAPRWGYREYEYESPRYEAWEERHERHHWRRY